MIVQKKIVLLIFFLSTSQLFCATPLARQLKQVGYVEICDLQNGAQAFQILYTYFDELVTFLQSNPTWAQKLYSAKERFIRSKERSYYSTDFFGLYDESKREKRNQISFYYSIHFHEFIFLHYPEFKKIPEMVHFFDACCEIQKPYASIFEHVAAELELKEIFSSAYNKPPILLKVVKYFPSYVTTKPHYDGTAFSLFLDSTDNQSLFLSAYKSSFVVDDFSAAVRKYSRQCNQNSIMLIPGAFLTEFCIYPTPHIVVQSGNVRYATIAFAMRPNYVAQKNELAILPDFRQR